jgi:hypothetical protein
LWASPITSSTTTATALYRCNREAVVECNGPYYGFTAIIDSAGNGKFELVRAPTRSQTIFTSMPRVKASSARFASKPRAVESPASMAAKIGRQ